MMLAKSADWEKWKKITRESELYIKIFNSKSNLNIEGKSRHNCSTLHYMTLHVHNIHPLILIFEKKKHFCHIETNYSSNIVFLSSLKIEICATVYI